MTEGFTTKEIVTKLLEKVEKIEEKVDNIHSQTTTTNGTVQLHTKLIWGAYGFTFALFIAILSVAPKLLNI